MSLAIANLVQAAAVIFLAFVFHFMPRWAKPGILFTITVPVNFRESAQGEEIFDGYQRRILWWSLPAVALGVLGVVRSNLFWGIAGQLLLVVGGLLTILWAREQVRPFAVEANPVREASLVRPAEKLPGHWLAWLGPLFLYAAFGAWAYYAWDSVPDRYPVHYNVHLEPDRWATKSVSSLLSPLSYGFFIYVMFLPLGWAILNRSRRVHITGEAAEFETNRKRAIAEMILVTNYYASAVFIFIAAMPWLQSPENAKILIVASYLGATGGGFGVAIYGLIRYGKYFMTSNRSAEAGDGDAPTGDRTPDECWKGGVVYINRDDPAWIVENRVGMGFTANFGHPAVCLYMFLLIAGPIAIAMTSF